MKLSAKTAGLCLLVSAYAVSAFIVFRHTEKAAEPGRVTIRIAQWQLESGVREAIDAIIRRYEKINPHVHVVQIAVPGGPIYVSWVLTQMTGGTAPDLVEYSVSDPDVARYFQPLTAEVLQPNPYNRGTPLEGVPWRDTFVDDMVGMDEFNPQLHQYYGIPLNTNASRIVYNLPLLRKITGSDQPPATYRDLLAMTDRIRAYAKANGLKLAPIANSRDTYEYLTWMIQMALTNRFSESIDFQHRLKVEPQEVGQSYVRGDWSYDSPPLVALLQELREYGLMCSPGFWGRERDTAVTDFVTGNAVMIVAPSWEATNLLALSKFPIGAFQFPYPREDDPVYGRFARGPFSDGQIQAGMPIYLSRNTRHRAEAIDFLRFMSSVEGSTIFTQVSNWPPATADVKPSSFAASFEFNPDGYSAYGNYLAPSSDVDSEWFIKTHYASLWSPDGSVDLYRKELREGIGNTIRSDLQRDIASGLDNLRRQDTAAAAEAELAPPGKPLEVLPLVAVPLETRIYQTRAVLGTGLQIPDAQRTEPGEIRSRVRGPDAAGAEAARAAAPPRLAAAWKELAGLRASRALELFDRDISSQDPEVARAARFGRAVSLLDKQPVTPTELAQARGLFTDLAANGVGDIAQGARFFLGRMAQHHQQEPDPLEAARQYGLLLAENPDSVWAQTALAPLALLEIYDFGSSLPPQSRVARAEKLLALARTPAAQCNLHLVMANAIFFYRLPAGEALPHLLAAERSDRLDRPERTEVLVQIAELSRLAGESAQAEEFYRTFLRENPVDFRCYMVRERLKDLEKKV